MTILTTRISHVFLRQCFILTRDYDKELLFLRFFEDYTLFYK